LKHFGSVTVLNGHIHQTLKKVEGNVTFHTATSTAFPQPAPGAAPKPGPMQVAPEILPTVLGITEVTLTHSHALTHLHEKPAAQPPNTDPVSWLTLNCDAAVPPPSALTRSRLRS